MPIKCPNCDRIFKNNAGLANHIKTHDYIVQTAEDIVKDIPKIDKLQQIIESFPIKKNIANNNAIGDYPEVINEHKIYNIYSKFIYYTIIHIIDSDRKDDIIDKKIKDMPKEIKDYAVKFKKSYKVYKDKQYDTEQILKYIFNMAIFSLITPDNLEYLDYVDTKLDPDEISYNELYDYFKDKNNISNKSVGKYVDGFINIMSNDNIIIVKVSKYDNPEKHKAFYKPFINALLTKKKIKKLVIFNPITMIEYYINLSKWDGKKDLIKILNKYYS